MWTLVSIHVCCVFLEGAKGNVGAKGERGEKGQKVYIYTHMQSRIICEHGTLRYG